MNKSGPTNLLLKPPEFDSNHAHFLIFIERASRMPQHTAQLGVVRAFRDLECGENIRLEFGYC
jgi:hypothetical protein